jgi:hypothetical protein
MAYRASPRAKATPERTLQNPTLALVAMAFGAPLFEIVLIPVFRLQNGID